MLDSKVASQEKHSRRICIAEKISQEMHRGRSIPGIIRRGCCYNRRDQGTERPSFDYPKRLSIFKTCSRNKSLTVHCGTQIWYGGGRRLDGLVRQAEDLAPQLAPPRIQERSLIGP